MKKYVDVCIFQRFGILQTVNFYVQDGDLGSEKATKIINIAVLPLAVAATTGVVSSLAIGVASSVAFGAAYAGYQLTNRLCSLAFDIRDAVKDININHSMSRKLNCYYQGAKLASALIGIGLAATLMATTSIPVLASVAIGCLAMQVLDFAINALFAKLFDKYTDLKHPIDWKPGSNAIGNLASLGAFVAGAAVATAVSSVCPLPLVGEAASAATTAGIEVAAAGIATYIEARRTPRPQHEKA